MTCALSLVCASSSAESPIQICVPEGFDDALTRAVQEAHTHGKLAALGMDIQMTPLKRSIRPSQLTSIAGKIAKSLFLDRGVARKVAAGTCHIGIIPFDYLLLPDAHSYLSRIQPVLLSLATKSDDPALVVVADSSIRTVADLKGKRIHVSHVAAHMALYKMLRSHGLNINDVKLDFRTRASQIMSRLDSGLLDAATLPTPSLGRELRVLQADMLKTYVVKSPPRSLLIANPAYMTEFGTRVADVAAMIASAQRPNTKFLDLMEKVSRKKQKERRVIFRRVVQYVAIVRDFGYILRSPDLLSWLNPKRSSNEDEVSQSR